MENKEKKKEKKVIGIYEATCSVCGRVFYPTPLWAWKIDGERFCKYSCMRVKETKKYGKRKRRVQM